MCGGRLDILVEFVAADPANMKIFQGLSDSLRKGTKCYLVADLGSVSAQSATVKRCLIHRDGKISGDMICPPGLMEAVYRWTGKERYPVLLPIEGRNYLVEPSFVPGTVWTVRAGHVSQQVAPLAKSVDFRTVVLDDRSDSRIRERFPLSEEVRVLPSFHNSLTALDMEEDSYIAISRC